MTPKAKPVTGAACGMGMGIGTVIGLPIGYGYGGFSLTALTREVEEPWLRVRIAMD